MSQQPQSSSNEANFSFAPLAPAAISDTPGSAESGGGGAISYRAPGSGASSNSFWMISNAGSHRGSAKRSSSARSHRTGRSPTNAVKDLSDQCQSGVVTREGEVSRTATSSKRKSSGSATRNESEARLRRQLHHVNDKLERSEQARTELENRLGLYQDALSHRDQMINNVEVYSHQHHEEYQEHVNSEMEYMRQSINDAYRLLDEQSHALAEAHIMDEGSTMRILELERRGELAEADAARIVQESLAMRRRYHAELESASFHIREQHEQSEAVTEHFHHNGLQLREACAQYVSDRETATKMEMEQLTQKLEESSQMMTANNEMIMEHGQQAVALRDERVAELQSTIEELKENLAKKDMVIADHDGIARGRFVRIREMANMAHQKEEEHLWVKNKLQVEINHLMKLNEGEIASKEWQEKRYLEERAEFREFKDVELRAYKDRENNLEAVKDEFIDENNGLIESNKQLRSRIAELIGSRITASGDEANSKMIEELKEELHRANLEIQRLQEGIECNPNLTQALVDAEEEEAERWKKMYQLTCRERDAAIRKNADLSLSLREARKAMMARSSSSTPAAPVTPVPASPSNLPHTSLIPSTPATNAVTPSFALPNATSGGTPKASSSTKGYGFAFPPPPSVGSANMNQTTTEMDDLREKLRLAEERAQQNYDEMKEYQSWLQQVEEGQETLKGSNAPEYDPVPNNPPGLCHRKDGKDASVANSDVDQDGKEWITRISRKEHKKVVVKPWPKCQDLDVWRSNVVQAVCVASGDPDTAAWRRWLTPAQLPDPDYTELADSGDCRFQSIDSKLSIALQNMVDNAGEVASEVRVRIRQRSQVLGREGNFLMGREILAMVLDHFRTTSKDEVLFNASHIYKLQYRGDKEMDKFLNAWIEIIANMKVEDIPSDNTLRDHLLRKIDGSQALHVDLTILKGRENDDKKKTYKELLEIMKRHIARVREERNMAARDKFATDYANLGKPSAPAPKPAVPTPTPKDGKTGKPSAPAPKGKPGAPVLPSGNPKSHGKGKGKDSRRSRSPCTRDPSKTFCHFHFNKGNCKHGDKCQYSHSQYHWDKRKGKNGKGRNGRSTTPRRSQTPGGKRDHNCYGWLKGECKKGDKCTFKHDPNMKGKKAAPSTKPPDAKATPALIREYDDDVIAGAMPSEKKVKKNVDFCYHVDTFEYTKPDFVQCSNRRPRRNMSRAQKQALTCRSTHDIMSDQQWVLQARLGMTRARAIGI